MLHRVCVTTAATVSLWLAGSSPALAQGQAKSSKKMEMTATSVGDLKWTDLKVPGFDPGAQMSVLSGNPNGKGGVYTLRLKFPAGYRFPSHWHPNAENLTVLSGSFQLGMGGTEDMSTEKTYGPGDFLNIPGTHPHHGGSTQESVVQLHGVGPFQIFLSKSAPKKKAAGL